MSLFWLASSTFAIPVRPGMWRIITLDNGTEVRALLQGDEHLSYYEDEDGNTYTANANGTFSLADIDQLVASTKERLASIRKKASLRAPQKIGSFNQNYTGKKRCLILLAQFTDVKFAQQHDNAFYQRVANEEGFTNDEGFRGSVRDYFLAQSNGLFELNFDIAGPYTMPKASTYYGQQVGANNDAHPAEMVATVCQMAYNDGVDFSKYDWEGDGSVDMVFVIYAGYGQATSQNRPDVIWPHQSALDYSGLGLDLNGKHISVYACSNEIDEINDTSKPHVQGIGAICHEFSHCLGYPDLYDTGTGTRFGMGHWDLMSSGSYNGDTFRPAGYTSYEKWMAGWITPTELSNTDVQVNNLKAISENGGAYIIYNQRNRNEYYLLENRQLTGWDDNLPGNGLQITHVDYDSQAWTYNTVNSGDHQRLTIFHADNTAGSANESTDLYPCRNNNSLTNNTTPAASLFNTNTDGSLYMNHGVTNITRNADGTVSFKYEAVSKTQEPEQKEEVVLHETFAGCNGEGGNGNGALFGGMVGMGTFASDIAGWTSNANMYGGKNCAKIGRPSDKTVTVTSPAFTMSRKGKVTVEVAPWASNAQTLTLSAGDTTLGTFNMTNNKWNTFEADINSTGSTQLTLSSNGRLWINEVTVTLPIETGIKDIATKQPTKTTQRIYTIGGQYVGSLLDTLPKGIYIVDGKKVVK